MFLISWLKNKINQAIDRIWKNDWFFHKYHAVYAWFFPDATSLKPYNDAKSWLSHIVSMNKHPGIEERYKHTNRNFIQTYKHAISPTYDYDDNYKLPFQNTYIDVEAMSIIIRGLNVTPVQNIEFAPGLITDDAMQILADFIAENRSIKKFSIRGGYTDWSLRSHIKPRTPISDNAIKKLVNGLQKNKVIQTLMLDKIDVSESGWSYITDLLQNNHAIKEIILTDNVINVALTKQIISAIEKRHIKVLDLSWSKLGDEGSKVIANYLASGANIETIILSGNNIREDGLTAIASALKSKKIKLKDLNLSGNSQALMNIDGKEILDENRINVSNDSGIEAIFNALLENTTLETIILSGMYVARILVMAAIVVKNNCTLRTMDLSDNQTNIFQANPYRLMPLATSLAANNTLETLNLSYNGIITEDLMDLSKFINQFTLKNLNVNHNNLHSTNSLDFGLLALANGLRANRSFVNLDLHFMNISYGNKLRHTAFNPIIESLALHPTLRKLRVTNNIISGDIIAEMLLNPECKIQYLHYDPNIDDLKYLEKRISLQPESINLTTLRLDLPYFDRAPFLAQTHAVINPINAHRKKMLYSFYSFMMIGNKERFGKEHHKEEKERKLKKLPKLPTEIGKIIFEYADYKGFLKVKFC